MPIIPTPDEARELRALFADHPIIALALAWLRANTVDRVADVVDVLPMWEHFAQLAEREVAAVYAAYTPEPAESCARCGAAVRWVTDGPDPGWWTHADLDAMLVNPDHNPHPAIPAYPGGER